MILQTCNVIEPLHVKTYKKTFAPSEDADQTGHPIRVLVVCLKKHGVLNYPLSALRRLWSDWVDVQADQSLRWAHRSLCWFWHEAAQLYRHWKELNFGSVSETSSRSISMCANSEWDGSNESSLLAKTCSWCQEYTVDDWTISGCVFVDLT